METVLKSSFGASFSQIVAIGISYILDFKINIKTSNFIGNFIGFLVNYVFQVRAFNAQGGNKTKHFIYFSLQEAITILVNQILFVYFLKTQHKLTPTILRIIIATIVFFIVSYPLRKRWVFKDEKIN